ncbi:MAG TPA: non-ribosomal peptide synthetase, partial [Micromonosporaceae bacterium]
GLARPELILRESGITQLAGGADKDQRAADEGGWVYFTSGSTGVPKPVLGSAVGIRSFVDWFIPEFDIRPADRFAFLTGVSFEASLRDIFAPLAAGAAVVLPTDDDTASPEVTVAWLARERISLVTVVPSIARGWLRHGRTTCPTVRAVFFIGEPLAPDVLAGWHARFPATAVRVNSYGSTESGQGTIYRRVAPDERIGDRVPAGKPVPGTRFCLVRPDATLDAELIRQALNHPATSGEIVIVSRACSLGYLGLPVANRARFAHLGDGVTGYRTGDLGTVDGNGDLVVIGRVDDEVKINGVRVHPVEVTRALRDQPAVADAFVTATRTDQTACLTGYVVPATGRPFSIPALRRGLMDVLPSVMIPAGFVELTELPRTRSGKVDRAALTALAESAAPDGDVPPLGEVESWLAGQLAELLDIERPSAATDLFALGCDCIVAASLAARIEQEYGMRLSVLEIFVAATIRDIAAAIEEHALLAADPAELEALLDALDTDALDVEALDVEALEDGALAGGERA